MSEQWRRGALGEFIELKRGYDLPNADRRAGAVPIISSSGPSGWHDEAKAKAPGVVTGRYGTIGNVFFIEQDFWPLNTTLYVRDFKGNDQRFVSYFLRSLDFQSFNDKSSVPGLNRNDLHRAPVLFPPLDEQREIAALLGALDDKIEQNRRTGRALEGLARGTFKAWFVDFEPVEAKAVGATSFPGMPSAAFAALPDRLTDSSLGPVPQDWTIKSLSEVATLSKQQINPQDHADELFEHFSIPAYDAGQDPVIEAGSGIKSQKFVVVPGCVLLSKLNPRIPRVWLPSLPNGLRQVASTEFLVAVPRPGWTREFLYCLFQQGNLRDSLAQSASGTSSSHQRVRPSDLLARPLPVPPKPILDAFADLVVPQLAFREALQAQSAKLGALRDYLLPRLLSGQVGVRPS